MTHIAVLSLGKAPGTTVLAAAMTAEATHRAMPDPLLVELDPTGGDLAARWGMSVNQGTLAVTAAASAHGVAGAEHLNNAAQSAPFGGRVLLGPPGGDAASIAAAELGGRWGLVLSEWGSREGGGTVVCDAGRWSPRQPEANRVRSAGTVIALIGADLAGVDRARQDLPALARLIAPVPVTGLLVGGPFTETDVATELRRILIAGTVPWDQTTARAVLDGNWSKRASRSVLGRLANELLVNAEATSVPEGVS